MRHGSIYRLIGRAKPTQVFARERGGSHAVTPLKGPEDFAVVRDDFLPEQRGCLGSREPSGQHAKERGGEDVEQRVPGGLNDQTVEGLVATCQLGWVAVTRVEEGRLECAELRVACPCRGKLSGRYFNQLANFNELTY